MTMPFRKIITEKEHGFTLVELIIVIIIVGILAAVGISQYSITVEKGRLVEAKRRIATMRQLALEYYLDNGTMTGINNAYVGVDNTCTSTDFYRYGLGTVAADRANLRATRCTSGGKTPNGIYYYYFGLTYYPATEDGTWYCSSTDDPTICAKLL